LEIRKILAQAWGLASEFIFAKGAKNLDPSILHHEEKAWINLILNNPQVRSYPPPVLGKPKDWKI